MNTQTLLIDTLERAQERFLQTLEQMTPEQANTMPHPLIKSVAWLIWHSARVLDFQLTHLAGKEPLYHSGRWLEKFRLDLPEDTQDWQHSPEEAAKVQVQDFALLRDYLAACMDFARDYLNGLAAESLEEIIDFTWNPPVSRGVRLVSTIDDVVMHSGQAVYTRRLVLGK